MEKKFELLAKTLMDASKIMFVSVFANYLLSSNQINYANLLLMLLFVMIIGYMGWVVHPVAVVKGEE